MESVLLDTNVLLDVLLDRQPHAEASAAVWAKVEAKIVRGWVTAHALTTIHSLYRKESSAAAARKAVGSLIQIFSVAPVDGAVLQEALATNLNDFEDAVTAAAARRSGCEAIVTRDPKGFRDAVIRAVTPRDYIAREAR